MISNKIVIEKAKKLGFDLVGFAAADELKEEIQRLEEWLSRKYQSGMSYMERNIEKRRDVKNILPSAKSVISLALNYYNNEQFSSQEGTGKISRYAWGKDYHLILWDKLDKLINALKGIDPAFEAVSYVDTGPLLDKAWAVKAGLGWMGKHTNVITKDYGSWVFLSTIITNHSFNYSTTIPDFCGTCTRCIDACPTNAIVNEYVVDANRCISYLTIENKGDIPDEFSGKFENWVFGCDICQDVCPWNGKFSNESKEDFYPVNIELRLNDIMEMDNTEFKKRFSVSPVSRAKLKGLQRNAKFLMKG